MSPFPVSRRNNTLLYKSFVLPVKFSNGSLKGSIISYNGNRSDVIVMWAKYDKFFTMPMVDVDSEELTIPDTDSSLVFSMESKKFKLLIDQFSNFGDDIEFNYCEDELKLVSDNNTEGSMKINIKLDDMESCEVEEDLEFNCSYSLKQISNMAQFFKLTSDLFIHISPDQPFKLLYRLEDENYFRFFLAPKVSNN